VNHGDLRRIRAFPVDKPPLHRVAKRDDPGGLSHEKSIHLRQRVVDDAAPKILEEHGDFRKDVLAQKHERRSRPGGRRKRRETHDWRIGQRHHDIGPPDALSFEDGRSEISHIVSRTSREAARIQRRSSAPDDVHAVTPLGIGQPRIRT